MTYFGIPTCINNKYVFWIPVCKFQIPVTGFWLPDSACGAIPIWGLETLALIALPKTVVEHRYIYSV